MTAPPSRWLRLTSPSMHGTDVERLQKALNSRLRARRQSPISVDGAYGPATQAAVHAVLWALGCPSTDLDVGATTKHQKIIRDPKQRPNSWFTIADDRKKWSQKQANSVTGLLAWLRRYVGKHEQPVDSNRGAWLDPLLREAGFNPGRGVHGPPYCGIGVINGLRAAGVAVPNTWAYVPNILADARNGRYGFKIVDKAHRAPGDVLVMDFGYDRVLGEHTGFVEDSGHTIEFNTSAGSSGNQQNGGGCYRRNWADREGAVVAVVRPPWHR